LTGKNTLPPTYLLSAIVIMAVLHFVVPIAKVIPRPWNFFGTIPLALGIVINVIASNDFDRVGTTVKPFEGSSALVTTGVFRLSRHPMYLGFVLILIGIAVIMRSLTPYVVIPCFAILMDTVFIRVEERMLEEQFGDDWFEYKREVRRWI